jgi:hypothetical protein
MTIHREIRLLKPHVFTQPGPIAVGQRHFVNVCCAVASGPPDVLAGIEFMPMLRKD